MDNQRNYQQGIAFPVVLTSEGGPIYNEIMDSVQASVESIISWEIYRRAYSVTYGSVTAMLWLPGIASNRKVIEKHLKISILENDYRVVAATVNIVDDLGRVFIEVLVTVTNNKSIYIKTEL